MSAPKPFERKQSANEEVNKLQERIDAYLHQLKGCPLLVGNLLKDINVKSASAGMVSHKLNRKPEGWIVVGINANAVVYEAKECTDKALYLRSSADVIVDIWVF